MGKYEDMQKSVERHKNAKVYSDAAIFSGQSLRDIHADLGEAIEADRAGDGDASMVVRDGRKEDGSPETWVHVRVGGEDVGTTNASTNCPPLPPEYCEA